jgi:hypothetical protein
MKVSDVNMFQEKVKDSLKAWANNKIDILFPNKPQVRAIVKNGISNIMCRVNDNINSYIDNLVLFLGDKDGNVDTDSMVDMAVNIFNEMEESSLDLGMVSIRTNRGELFIDLPNNIFLNMLVGNLGSVRLTSEDFKELKNYLN